MTDRTTNKSLVKAIKREHPNLTPNQINEFIYNLQGEIAKHIRSGDALAFVKQKSDGKVELAVIALEQLVKN